MRKCRVIIDSCSRFGDGDDLYYMNLPQDEYGWNRFMAECDGQSIFYEGKKVVDLDTISHCDKGVHEDGEYDSSEDSESPPTGELYRYRWYYVYVSEGKLTEKEKEYVGNYLEDTTLYFNDHPMTDAHIHFEIIILKI